MISQSLDLGNHFENFIQASLDTGRYKNISDVIRAALRLLEENELKIKSLQSAINIGLESGVAESFDPYGFLQDIPTHFSK